MIYVDIYEKLKKVHNGMVYSLFLFNMRVWHVPLLIRKSKLSITIRYVDNRSTEC